MLSIVGQSCTNAAQRHDGRPLGEHGHRRGGEEVPPRARMAKHHEGRLGPRSSGSQGRGIHRAGRIESQWKPPLAKINSERDNL